MLLLPDIVAGLARHNGLFAAMITMGTQTDRQIPYQAMPTKETDDRVPGRHNPMLDAHRHPIPEATGTPPGHPPSISRKTDA